MEVPAEWEQILNDLAALERENAQLQALVAKLRANKETK